MSVEGGLDAAVSNKSTISELNIAYASVAIVEMITKYLSGFDVMALWCTCSKAMQVRLARGGVREFVISYTAVKGWSANFYTVLRMMPCLQSVVLQQSSLAIWQSGPRLLEAFPATLRRMTLCLPMQLGVWLLLNTVPKTSRKSALQIRATKKKRSARLETKIFEVQVPDFRMAELFPSLETLSISGGVSYAPNPRFVLKYSANNSELFSTETCQKAKLAFARSLPHTITFISLPELGDATWPMIQAMPTSLSHMDISCTFTKIPETGFSSLPPHLSSASFNLVDCVWDPDLPCFHQLPSSLQRAEILISSADGPKSFSGLRDHPMTHLTLSLYGLYEHLKNVLLDVPHQLEYMELSLRSAWLSDDTDFGSLPRSLHTLIFHFLSLGHRRWPLNGFEGLPPHLTRLELYSSFPVYISDIAILPRSITHLYLGIGAESFEGHPNACTSRCENRHLTDECAQFLPANLVYLKLGETSFGRNFLHNLPSQLKTLDFETKAFLSSDAFDMLPESLTSLTIRAEMHKNGLTQLPSAITRLYVENSGSWDPASLSLLPEALRYLDLHKCTKISDVLVKHLPRQLLELRIPEASDISCESLKYLPRTLETLVVAKIIVPHPRPAKVDILTQLPQRIQAYELPWTQRNGRKVDLTTLP